MAEIRSYTSQILAQGASATPEDFGAQTGAALQNVGGALSDVAQTLFQQDAADEVTQAHVLAAQQRVKWQQELQDRQNSADPSDKTFAPKLMEDMKTSWNELGGQFKTRAGQTAFAKLSADMTSMFGQEAISAQGRLAGIDAKNKYDKSMASFGQLAAQDHTQWQSLAKQADALVDTFTQVPQTTRDALKENARQQILYDTAIGFARRYPDAVLGSVPKELQDTVRQVQQGQAPTPPGLPPDLNAPMVKPYDQKRIDEVAAMVAKPSPYDQYFEDAARLYGLDARDLKLRAAVESSLDPRVISPQGAKGLMQFTDATAARYGLDDVKDPKKSIFAGARMMAELKKKSGGDMVTVDKMYYGGESGTAWGANTNQYAANMAAARNAIGLGTPVQPAAFVAPAPVQIADRTGGKKPTTGLPFIDDLPADKFFDVLSKAEHYQSVANSQMERDRIERDRIAREQQENVMKGMYARIINPTPENGGKLTEQEIINNSGLKFEQQQHMVQTLMARSRELAAGLEAKRNPDEVAALERRIYAPSNSPDKLYDAEEIFKSYRAGRLSTQELLSLNRQVADLQDPNTNAFTRQARSVKELAFRSLQQNRMLQGLDAANPGLLADVAHQFNEDLENRITAMRQANKDPRELFNPKSREYVLDPAHIQTFIPSMGASMRDAAAQQAQQSGMQPGTVVKGYRFKGGDPADKSNWEKI